MPLLVLRRIAWAQLCQSVPGLWAFRHIHLAVLQCVHRQLQLCRRWQRLRRLLQGLLQRRRGSWLSGQRPERRESLPSMPGRECAFELVSWCWWARQCMLRLHYLQHGWVRRWRWRLPRRAWRRRRLEWGSHLRLLVVVFQLWPGRQQL